MIDVVIPTQFPVARRFTLLHQIKTALNQGVEARVLILCTGREWDENKDWLSSKITSGEISESASITPIFHPENHLYPLQWEGAVHPNPAVLGYMNQADGDWMYLCNDDDAMMPWALKYLLAASPGFDMVVGRIVSVSRNYEDRRDYLVGNTLDRNHCDLACSIVSIPFLKTMAQPVFNIHSGTADWELMNNIANTGKVNFIPQIVAVKSLTL